MKNSAELEHQDVQPSEYTYGLKRTFNWLIQLPRWPLIVILFFLFNIGAWFAPLAMQAGWTRTGNAIYTIYSPFCHQMAQRSFFLFGEKAMYSPQEMGIPLTDNLGVDTLMMRNFRGNDRLGWKVAWSDRMVYMYGSMWLALLIFWLVSHFRTIKPAAPWLLGVVLLPMIMDGGSHFLSDFGGLMHGFRYNNAWLAILTNHIFPEQFYVGDTLGSFNAWMRLLSGVIFGFGLIWFILPYLIQGSAIIGLDIRQSVNTSSNMDRMD